MPIYRGTYYTRTFQFTDEAGAALDITGWEFQSYWRAGKSDTGDPLLDLTTANGGWLVTNGVGGLLQLKILAAQTPLLTGSKAFFDVLRTDPTPGPIWLFEGNVPVKNPITTPP